MVTNSVKYASAILFLCSVAACTKYEAPEKDDARLPLTVTAVNGETSRAVYDAANACAKWTAGESIGVAATQNGLFTDSVLQEFTGDNEALSQSAEFSGSLADGGAGTYKLYAFSPFHLSMHTASATINLPNLQYPEVSGWDTGCDFMLGQSAEQICDANVSQANGAITFTHTMGWLRLSFSGFGASQNEKVEYVRITADTAIAGDFEVDLKNQSISTAGAADKFIMADYTDKDITLGDLTAYITMFPGDYASIDIAVRTTGHYIECTRTGLSLAAGEMKSATVNFDSGNDSNAESQAGLCSASLPSMSSKTDGTLNVLLIGHSFGLDCTEHLPGLLQDAGITNLNLCRFHQNDCELGEYWNFIKTETCPQKFMSRVNDGWSASSSRTINSKLKDTAWDVIILQQSTCEGRGQIGPDWGGAANYSTYQPYLSQLLEYIVSTQRTRQSKTPYIAWNMIHSSQGYWQDKYTKIVEATTSMKAATGIKLILTPATAMMTARTSTSYSFDFTNVSTYHILCRDLGSGGWHASLGLGRYLEACTWFEQLVCPIYKAADASLTVVGNEFYPVIEEKQYDGDKGADPNYHTNDAVTAEKAAALQAIAHDTKLVNPFSATNPV